MHIKSLVLATLAAAALAFSFASPTFAGPDGCFPVGTQSLFGGKLTREMCWDGKTLNPLTHTGAPVKVVIVPVAPVDPVLPVDPEEPVAELPEHPAHPGELGTQVSLIGTVFEGFPAGTYTQIFAPIIPEYDFPGGVVDAIVFEDGTAYVWVISTGLPGQA